MKSEEEQTAAVAELRREDGDLRGEGLYCGGNRPVSKGQQETAQRGKQFSDNPVS